MKYELKYHFFESPNFSLTGSPETVVLAQVENPESAKIFAKAYAAEVISSLGHPINSLKELTSDDVFGYTCNVAGDYLTIMYGLDDPVIVARFTIEKLCPNCGCNPNSSPYYMEPTHCPKCGHVFEE
jgi:hypothetical protein